MKRLLAIARMFAALALVLGLPTQGSAYMTLFNDDGNWAAATLPIRKMEK